MSSAKFPRQKVRLPFSRSKSGCLICRSQHKKCDERKPSCSSCRAKGVSCQWPPSRDAVYEPEVNSSRTPSIAGPSTPSPTPSFLPVEIARVYTLSPGSARFLEYYVAETSRYFMSRSDQQNPYLTELLPFAYSDDLVLDCILALGGTHLELKTGSPNTALWASWHAVRAVRMLRESIYEAPQSPTQSLRVLLALLLLCSLEAFSATPQHSELHHLRAGRRLVTYLTDRSKDKGSENRALRGLALELYGYIALVTSVTPYTNGTETEPDTRYGYWPLTRGYLEQYETFGVLVANIYEYLEVVPQVASLCHYRQSELLHDPSGGSGSSWIDFLRILDRLKLIHGRAEGRDPSNGSETQQQEPAEILSRLYYHALTIFAYDAMWCGSLGDDPDRTALVQRHARTALELIARLSSSQFRNILLWPSVVIGSCLVEEGDRDCLRKTAIDEPRQIPLVRRAHEGLEMLWHRLDQEYYGPYGLHKLMVSRDLVLSVQ